MTEICLHGIEIQFPCQDCIQNSFFDPPPTQLVRRFLLKRSKDVSGVSGTGIVAQGAQFADGICVMEWLTKISSIAIYKSADELIEIHGHEGSTEIVWE